ncbi:MAG: hypothetical protein ACTSQH_07395, partial [Candidatus Hodarchaeales archaeon]
IEITSFWFVFATWKEVWVMLAGDKITASNPFNDADDYYHIGISDWGSSGTDNADTVVNKKIGSGSTTYPHNGGEGDLSEGTNRVEKRDGVIKFYWNSELVYSEAWALNNESMKYLYIYGFTTGNNDQLDLDKFSFDIVGGTHEKHIYAGGMHIASNTTGTIEYYHQRITDTRANMRTHLDCTILGQGTMTH